MPVTKKKNGFSVKAYQGDAKTLLAFLDRSAAIANTTPTKIKAASLQQQAVEAGWFLSTSDRWAARISIRTTCTAWTANFLVSPILASKPSRR